VLGGLGWVLVFDSDGKDAWRLGVTMNDWDAAMVSSKVSEVFRKKDSG
jgi:hypothetical protein